MTEDSSSFEHRTTRRAVLGAGLGLAGLAVVGVGHTAADAATVSSLPVRSHYDPSLKKTFTVQHAGRAYALTLASVQALAHTTKAQQQSCFLLLFTPARGVRLPDGIYVPRRYGVPQHSLFLSRVGASGTLQAVINRAH